MDLSYDDVLQILDLVENSNIEYLEVEVGATKIVASKNAQPIVTGRGAATTQPSGPVKDLRPSQVSPEQPVKAVSPLPESTPAKSTPAKPTPATGVDIDPNLVQVNAPVVGVFYRQSEPGAPPYVEIGSKVEVGSTLGLLEVMKMFTSVTSPVEGEVVDVKAENNDFVEFEQLLFVIKPTL